MSTTPIIVKRQNHRVHPCKIKRKNELLDFLLTENEEKSIIIVVAINNLESIKNRIEKENITVIDDETLAKSPELTCDLLISYNLPDNANEYVTRLSHSNKNALILLDSEEQKKLYPIEMLLGRTIMQESVSGFEAFSEDTKKQEEKTFKSKPFKKEYKKTDNNTRRPKTYAKKSYSDDAKNRYTKDENNSKKSNYNDSNSKESNYKKDKWAKKDKEVSKYIGKDENGKAIFSNKTRERNHRYDGTPKTEAEKRSTSRRTIRKINIKPKKPE